MLLPALAKAKSKADGIKCMNNLKQLGLAWILWAGDNDEKVLACQDGFTGRPNWIEGSLDFVAASANRRYPTTSPMYPYVGHSYAVFTSRPNWIRGNLDSGAESANRRYLTNSPMFPYVGNSYEVFKCPSDKAMVTAVRDGVRAKYPRIRSNSMSQVFGYGEWLDKVN